LIEARIGGDGLTASFRDASDPASQVAMIDEWLTDHDLMYLEVKRDDPRSWTEAMTDPDHREFMRVGVASDWAAAEYVRGGLACPRPVVRATFSDGGSKRDVAVPYGERRCFPADAVISLAAVRQLMIDFVTTGEWAHRELWREHDHLVV
jgi:hypothetical protein